jgi:flagellar basal-body rod protein FlgB
MSDHTIKTLENLISLSSVRQKVISRNIANVNTEHYKREEVTFDDFLNNGLSTPMRATEEQHIGGAVADDFSDLHVRVVKDEAMTFNSGVNNVNIDKEMSDMAENQIMFKFASRRLATHFKTMQDIIKGGGK